VDALSNCEEVELFLNDQSLGRQAMKRNSKLTWPVKYAPGTLRAKGYKGGRVVAETKVETTGAPAAVQLTSQRTTLAADGRDAAVFTVSVTDAQGRPVPTAGNKIKFALSGAGKILGVGNGDPSCHEPDTYVAQTSGEAIPVPDWRWKLAAVPAQGAPAPEYANDFDDSGWNRIKPKTDGDTGGMVLREGQTAFFRAHATLTAAQLANPKIQIRFNCIDDHGWVFVNQQLVGESSDWSAQPCYEIKRALHAGDNVIVVGVRNENGSGGLDPGVNLELVGQPIPSDWSRSLFNGLGAVIVQSTREAGELRLTATADGLNSATATLTTQPAPSGPEAP
jgi:beta-galactosidase